MRRESDSIWTSALTLSSHLYSYVTVFTIFAQAGGLVAAYIIEITLHYEKLLETHCRVNKHNIIILFEVSIEGTCGYKREQVIFYYSYSRSQEKKYQIWLAM